MDDMATKREHLLAILGAMPGVAVALSGGVDSTVVAKAAFVALGNRAVAFTSDSASVPRTELAAAKTIAGAIGIRHIVLKTNEFADPNYQVNKGDRCYFCKSELYDRIAGVLVEHDLHTIVSGANLDDLGDYRPGLTAAAERHVRHPLQEAGFTKADVRKLAQYWELPVWDKPASPCLSSRLAPGLEVTAERTGRVEAAEAFLYSLGLKDCRVRYHPGDLARIEVPQDDLANIADVGTRQRIAKQFKELGFKFITLDLEGFRSGSLNDLVTLEMLTQHRGRS